jgi:hypothetical protein
MPTLINNFDDGQFFLSNRNERLKKRTLRSPSLHSVRTLRDYAAARGVDTQR